MCIKFPVRNAHVLVFLSLVAGTRTKLNVGPKGMFKYVSVFWTFQGKVPSVIEETFYPPPTTTPTPPLLLTS